MKITLEYEIDDESYAEFLQHDLVQEDPQEFFGVILDDYVPAILTGIKIEQND